MAKKKIATPSTLSTEEKIMEAARTVFTQKGYAATKTRDIAAQAGINLALLNYYFRSKEKLFELVMLESAQKLFMNLQDILNDEKTSIEKKLELLVAKYIDMLVNEPNFPLFMLSEIQANPDKLLKSLKAENILQKSFFFKQLGEYITKKKLKLHPLHYVVNIIGITVFPFAGKPLLKPLLKMSEQEFNALMIERKKLIPMWIKAAMLSA